MKSHQRLGGAEGRVEVFPLLLEVQREGCSGSRGWVWGGFPVPFKARERTDRGMAWVRDDASRTLPTRQSRGEGRPRGGVGACVCVTKHHALFTLCRASRCAAPVGEDMAGTGAGRGQFSGCCERSKTELRELNSSCKREQLGT